MSEEALTEFRFAGVIIEWRGPSPWFFLPVPTEFSCQLGVLAKAVSYGWGVIPVDGWLGDTPFTTSLFPKNGSYFLPLKAQVRRQAAVTAGDLVEVTMRIQATVR